MTNEPMKKNFVQKNNFLYIYKIEDVLKEETRNTVF